MDKIVQQIKINKDQALNQHQDIKDNMANQYLTTDFYFFYFKLYTKIKFVLENC